MLAKVSIKITLEEAHQRNVCLHENCREEVCRCWRHLFASNGGLTKLTQVRCRSRTKLSLGQAAIARPESTDARTNLGRNNSMGKRKASFKFPLSRLLAIVRPTRPTNRYTNKQSRSNLAVQTTPCNSKPSWIPLWF